MFTIRVFLLLPNLTAAAGMAAIALSILFRQRIAGSKISALTALTGAAWACCACVLIFDLPLQSKIVTVRVQHIFITLVPPLVLLVSQIYSGSSKWRQPSFVLPLFLTPCLMGVTIITDPYHQMFFSDFRIDNSGPLPFLVWQNGILFWIYVAHNYTLLFATAIILFSHRMQAPSIYQKQTTTLLFFLVFPWVSNVLYISGFSPIRNFDFTPMSFCVIVAGIAAHFIQSNLLDLVPVAKEMVFQNLRDPIIVLDPDLRLIDRNRAGIELLGTTGEKLTGKDGMEVLLPIFGDAAYMLISHADQAELTTRNQPQPKTYDVQVSTLRDMGTQKPMGRVIVFRDITERKHLESELRNLANTDPLTGSHNRRSFQMKAEQEIGRTVRYRRSLSLLLFDLDKFKNINDTYGHESGDQVLRVFAAITLEMCRKSDIFGRMGGEEFALLLPETSLDMARMVANRLRERFKANVFRFEAKPVHCTVSIGISAIETPDDNLKSLMARADAGLYAAKAAGRDRVVG